MATPAIRELKTSFPQATVDVLILSKYSELFEYNPYINRVELLSGKFKNYILFYKLRKRHYDILLDFTAVFPCAWISFFIGGDYRVGFARNTSLGFFNVNNFGFLYTHHVNYSEDNHLIHENLKLIKIWISEKGSPMMDLVVPHESIAEARDLIAKFDAAGKRIIAIHPGAKWQPKRWTEARFGELISRLSENKDLFPLLIGGPMDTHILENISKYSGVPVKMVICKNLMLLASLIKESTLLVCNDSGAMHIASSLDIPTVSLFGPVSPQRSKPLGSIHTILYKGLYCSPCQLYYSRERCMRGRNYCMEAIDVEEVLNKIYDIISIKRCQ